MALKMTNFCRRISQFWGISHFRRISQFWGISFRRICAVFFALFVGAMISACGGVEYPSWYLESDADSTHLYGVGSGESLESAKKMALNDLSSQISLSVDSAVSIEQSQIDDKQTHRANAKVDVSVLDIKLDSVEYVEGEEIDGIFYAKARIEKAKIVRQINDEMDGLVIEVNVILGAIKAMQCATISPQHKFSLSRFYGKLTHSAGQIYALDGKVRTQKAIDDLKTLLSNPSRAYYRASVGRTGGDFTRINSGLNAEYKKFFSLEDAGSDKFIIENEYKISSDMRTITLSVQIKDCTGNAIFSDSFIGKGGSYAQAVDRVRAQLYKKLKKWIETP